MKPLDWPAGTDLADAAAVTARVVSEFDGWAPQLTALLTNSDIAPVLRRLYTLPIGHRWAEARRYSARRRRPPVPPNGEGANLAMLDGAELGQAIAAHPEDVENGLADYEQAMFPRAAEAAAKTSTASSR